MNYYGAMLDWFRKCRGKLVFTRETKSARPSASIKGPIPGNRTAALVATMVTERVLKHISEDLQTLKWSNKNNKNNNNNELRTQNVKPTFRLHISYLWRNGTQGFFKNKAGSNAVTTHSDTKRNIPRGLSLAITLLHNTDSINKRVEQSWLWISSTWNWEENKSRTVYGWLETAR